MRPLLECRNVTMAYGSLIAVSGMNLTASGGEIVGIGGPNGAGKTTFFDIISGVTAPTQGSVVFDGRDISDTRADRVCFLGIAKTFQLNAAYESMTVAENVLCSMYFGRRNIVFPGISYLRSQRNEAKNILELTGLSALSEQRAGRLTVLQRKKLMLASALATNPRLLLLDEPVGGLNPREIDETIELVRRIHKDRGLTIILIEHVMRFIVELCDRVVIMHHGQQLYEGSTAGLTRDAKVVETYLGADAASRLDHILDGRSHHG